jgi:hypothetical protein
VILSEPDIPIYLEIGYCFIPLLIAWLMYVFLEWIMEKHDAQQRIYHEESKRRRHAGIDKMVEELHQEDIKRHNKNKD